MYIGRKETQFAKFLLKRIWEAYCGVALLFALLLWVDHHFGSKYIGASALLVSLVIANCAVVLVSVSYRLKRRYKRRHSCKEKGILHGWWFRYDYYRTPVNRQDRCYYSCYCLECHVSYEVKPAELKSFEHRPAFLYFW